MTPQIILWIYIGLLVAGGMVGLIKGGSKVSLIMSVACAVPLILCELKVIPFHASTWILLGLFVMFGWRFAQSKKFMPMGLLCALTLATLAALQFIR